MTIAYYSAYVPAECWVLM